MNRTALRNLILCALLAAAPLLPAQELSIALITRQADGSYAATATVRIPMASDAAARDAAAAMRFWIATASGIEAAAIIPLSASDDAVTERARQ